MQFKHKVLLFGVVALLVVLLVSNSIMVGVLISGRSDKNKLNSKVAELEKEAQEFEKIIEDLNNNSPEDEDNDDDEPAQITMQKFVDVNEDITIDYPSDWSVQTELTTGESLVQDPKLDQMGLVISSYKIFFKNGDTVLEFHKYYSDGFGGVTEPLTKDKYDFVKLNDMTVRFREKGKGDWSYKEIVDCEETENSENVCISLFFNQFGKTPFPANVSVNDTNSEDILKIADKIVLSAGN